MDIRTDAWPPRTDDRPPTLLSRLVRRLLLLLYRTHGWRAEGVVPEPRRFVIIAAPHTSNWDFLYFLGLTGDLGIKAHFMAKTSLFRWPFGNFMRQMGGVPVDRSAAGDMVQQMIAEFAARKDFILTIAPEGTRKSVDAWRTGFYRIALGAGVPIVCGFMDYGNRRAGLGPVIHPTGDYEKDMAPAFAFYSAMAGRNAVHK
jgi:1-acyl-sn-glycerol-3-phosphate acyltransferase